MSVKRSTVSGLHAVTGLLLKNPERIRRLHVLSGRDDKRIQEILKLAQDQKIPVERLSREALGALSQSEQHQGVLAECDAPRSFSEADLQALLAESKNPPLILILDGVQDPHNLGACLRSADAAGVTAVIVPKDRSVGLTETVVRVASGAADTVPLIQVTNLARTMSALKKQAVWIYGAAAEAERNVYAEKLTGPVALVMGAEGSGLRRLTAEHCDGLLKIPLQGSVSSLNVSVATGIFLFEVVRQRNG